MLMLENRRKKTAAATTMTAVAVTALVGGTLAQFTDSDTTAPQTLKTGTVQIDLVEGAGWNTNLINLAVGDTADRTVLVDNTSTLAVGAMRLTVDLTDQVGEFGGRLSEAITVDITQDNTVVLAQDVRLADLADGYNLTFAEADLPAGTDVNLGFHYEVTGARTAETGDRSQGARELPANPDNKYQGSGLTVAYTIDAIQRDGFDDRTPATPETVTATTEGTTATVSFAEPSTNPDGTVYTATAIDQSTVTAASTTPESGPANPASLSPTESTTILAVAAIGPSASGLHSPLTVTGLKPATTYRFAVTATMGGAESKPVYSAPVTTPVASGAVTAWGRNDYGQATVPANLGQVTKVSAGFEFTLALKADGTVVGWGRSDGSRIAIPSGLTGVTDIDAGAYHSLALKADGTVAGWGTGAAATPPAGLVNVKAVGVGKNHSLVLKEDGTLVAWGSNTYGQATVPAGLNDVVAIAVGGWHNVALKSDGTVVAWGWTQYKQTAVPAGLTNVVAIDAGDTHTLAQKSDGTLVAWGDNNTNKATIPASLAGVKVKAFSAGQGHNLVVKTDGTVVAWGAYDFKQNIVPAGTANALAVSAGGWHSVVVTQ